MVSWNLKENSNLNLRMPNDIVCIGPCFKIRMNQCGVSHRFIFHSGGDLSHSNHIPQREWWFFRPVCSCPCVLSRPVKQGPYFLSLTIESARNVCLCNIFEIIGCLWLIFSWSRFKVKVLWIWQSIEFINGADKFKDQNHNSGVDMLSFCKTKPFSIAFSEPTTSAINPVRHCHH